MLWKSKPHIFLILISLDSKGIRSRRRDDWSHTLGPFVSLAALQRISTWFEIVTWFEMCGCIKINWKPKLRGLLLVSSRSFGPYRPIDSIKSNFTPGFLLEYHWKSTNITNVNTTTYHYKYEKYQELHPFVTLVDLWVITIKKPRIFCVHSTWSKVTWVQDAFFVCWLAE